jgi:hypothetical protein
MEFIPFAIGLFFIIGWTVGILSQQQFATIPNRNIVIWWWVALTTLFLDGMSYWHLMWMLPSIALINVFAAISIRGFFGLIIGGLPVFILILF